MSAVVMCTTGAKWRPTRRGRTRSPEAARTAFGDALGRMMDEKQLTQERLAADLGYTQALVSRIVRGVTPPSRAFTERLAARYDIDRGRLLAIAGFVPAPGPPGPPGPPDPIRPVGQAEQGAKGGEVLYGEVLYGEVLYDAAAYAVAVVRRLQHEYGEQLDCVAVPLIPQDTPPEAVEYLVRPIEEKVRKKLGLPLSGGVLAGR